MLKEKISEDLKQALKSGDQAVSGTLRLIMAAFANREIDKRTKTGESILTSEEELEVLIKEAKQRKESAEAFLKGDRNDLMQKELNELEIIKNYLPEQLTSEEIEKIVDEAIVKIGASSVKNMGKVMAEVMKEAKGRADSREISEIIKNKINNNE